MTLFGKAILIGCGIVMFLPTSTPVIEARPATNMEMTILPLRCSIERTDNGLQELFRVVPEQCAKLLIIDGDPMEDPAIYYLQN